MFRLGWDAPPLIQPGATGESGFEAGTDAIQATELRSLQALSTI